MCDMQCLGVLVNFVLLWHRMHRNLCVMLNFCWIEDMSNKNVLGVQSTNTHTHTHTNTHTHTHTRTHTHTHTHKHTNTQALAVSFYQNAYINFKPSHTVAVPHTHMYTHKNTYTHKHMHTQINTRTQEHNIGAGKPGQL